TEYKYDTDMNDYEYDAEKMKNELDIGRVDILISCGGLLNNSVTGDTKVSKKFNRMYAKVVDEGGFCVAGGLSDLSVNSEDHLKNGQKIRNLHDLSTNRQIHVTYNEPPEVTLS